MAKQQIIQLATGEEIKLTERELLFCEHYLSDADRNATRAAVLAGYSERSARRTATENLSKLHISKYIKDKTAPMLEKLGITQEKVLAEFASVGFAKLSDFMEDDYSMKTLDQIDPSKVAAMESLQVDETISMDKNGNEVKERRVKFKMHDKLKALDKLYQVLNPDDKDEDDGKKQFFTQINNYITNK